MNENVIIVLAAGASSRLQQPKQLLTYDDQSLLVVVVLGAHSQEIMADVDDLEIDVVVNKNWESGMASSIKAGLEKAMEIYENMENCILAVCDQPYISSVLFQELVNQKKASGKKIVASSYAGTLGTPALFDKKYFEDLLNMQGDHGAKNLLQNYNEDVASVRFEKGEIDIDTKSDYDQLLKNRNL
jgi:molybdenum cofactor cytidylyltransferase